MKFLVGLLMIVIVFLVAGLAYYYGKSTVTNTAVEVTTLATPTQMATVTAGAASPAPTATVAPTTKKVNGGGILTFPKYELTVPNDWINTREVLGPDAEKIILKKDKYEFSITQGGFGGAACLYPGDADMEGPSARYEQFVEITTKSNDLLRRGWTGGGGFGICQKTQYGWGAPTLYGHIGINTTAVYTKEIVAEIDAILASITKK